jgi:prepilin-type N-terminal cleavage/methylation domain-containing protein
MKKGFTLIELLVVIAIIGILSSVVLASLNSARSKGSDAAVKENLANMRAEAALFYDNNGNSYNAGTGKNLCIDDSNVVKAKAAVGGANAVCSSTATGWLMAAPLTSVTGNFCVDGGGNAITVQTGTSTLAATTTCY